MKNFIKAITYYIFSYIVSNIPSYAIRHWYISRILRIEIGSGSSIHMGCFFTGRHIQIGSNSVINRKCYLDGRVGIKIGDNVSISPEVYILSLTHDAQDSHFGTIGLPTVLEDYTWIGARAMIMPGVTLSKGCVVGAGAVVTKSFEPFSIVAGVPAKKIGERNRELSYKLSYFPYFDTDIIN
jgi:acetyltransferase-like isoleucine patch superfamily enzyme